MLALDDIRQRLAALSPRERAMGLAGGALVVGYGIYLLAWQPLAESNSQLQQSLQSKRETYQYLQRIAAQAALSDNATTLAENPAAPADVIAASVEQMQLTQAIKQVQAQSEREVAVTMEQADFDHLIVWLAALADTHGANVLNVELKLHDGLPCMVDGKLVLGFY